MLWDKTKRENLLLWAAGKSCESPDEQRGGKYEVAWGEKRRDYKVTPCGLCVPCLAKLELGQELKTEEFTR